MGVPNRNNRPKFRSGVVSAAEIISSIASSGVKDDNETTGVMGIRDSKEQRKLSDEIKKSGRKK